MTELCGRESSRRSRAVAAMAVTSGGENELAESNCRWEAVAVAMAV